jgi:hypothetical protein
VIDDRRVPQPDVEFRVEPRLGSVLVAAVAVAVIAVPVAVSVQGSSWWSGAAAIAATVVLVAFIARALFSSVAITSSGIRVKNALRGEIAATWDQICEFQIVFTRSVPLCRVTLSDGTKVKIHAFEWPGSMNVLQEVHNWLARYDSPLRFHDQRWWKHAFCNDEVR